MAHDRVHDDVGLTPGRIDGPVSRRDRGQARLTLAQGHLVAPVDPLLIGGPGALGRLHEAHPPARVANVGVLEGADELPQRGGLPKRVGVREGNDLAARSLHGSVLRGDLAAAGKLQHDVGAGLSRAQGGPVLTPVAHHDHLEQLARVVESESVLHLRPDHLLLVMGGDDQGRISMGGIGSFP